MKNLTKDFPGGYYLLFNINPMVSLDRLIIYIG